jgi:uncharacterized protein YndB with AHSA1/START domain
VAEVRITDELLIQAPPSAVWAAIKDPAAHAEWHPFVTEIEGEHALGATRVCSVIVGKKHGTTHERCVEDEPAQRIIWAIDHDSTGFGRMVTDWRAGFGLRPAGEATCVTAESVFLPKGVMVRVMAPIVRRKFHQAQRAILGGLSDSCGRAES